MINIRKEGKEWVATAETGGIKVRAKSRKKALQKLYWRVRIAEIRRKLYSWFRKDS